jgi:ComF family protein
MRCALPLNTDIGSHRYPWTRRICSTCLNRPPPFDRSVAPFLMQDGFRELLHLWKFNNRPNLSRFLASLFKEAMIDVRAVPIASGTRPLLIPIPTQWHRQLWRGFDHTWLLAQALGHAINPDAEIRPWLRNSQKRQSHHQLSRALRWANSEGRFVGDDRIQGHDVILIDDVMTTGATVSSAAHACHLAGARSVYIWCLARTPAPPSAG